MAAEYLERMGQRMRERREELGMSRADVVREMPGKTNENQLYRWEKGLHRPEDDALEAIAVVLKVSGPSWFFAERPNGEPTPDLSGADGTQLDRIEKAVLQADVDREDIRQLLSRQSNILDGIERVLASQLSAAKRMEEAAALLRALRGHPEPPDETR